MPIQAESGESLLNESGESLLEETGEPNVITLQGRASLQLVARGALKGIANPIPLQSRATLRLVSRAKLSKATRLNGRASLQLIARHGAVAAPTGLTVWMKMITDPARPERVIDQYLLIGFNGHPNQCQATLQIDDGETLYPSSTWLNPGTTGPAIIKIDSAEIPGDGLTHKITIAVRVNSHGRTGPWARTEIYAKTPKSRPTDQPQWCDAVLIRQGGVGNTGPLLDLTRIRWRHDGAVRIMARIPILIGDEPRRWSTRDIGLGYADYDENEFIAEGIGLRLEYLGGYIRNVQFGVCAMDRGEFGPALWASNAVGIKEISNDDIQPPTLNPDQIAGTARDWSYAEFKDGVANTVKGQEANGYIIATTAIDKTLLVIKNVVSKGGSVTLDHFSRFEARWNSDNTTRSVGFVPSAGFKEGTRRGRIMTDTEAKAL